VLAPTVTISPRPWRELYPVEIDGKPTKSYFHWLALAYAVNARRPSGAVAPVGRDRNGMPFGCRSSARAAATCSCFAVATALESLLAKRCRDTRAPSPTLRS
jgi:Asp-tRNA(Asn)/Glu-tRNA(Gln) amidotransferase A subunit family amidase